MFPAAALDVMHHPGRIAFRPGDAVEFWSSRGGGEWRTGDQAPTGGVWLPAVLAELAELGDRGDYHVERQVRHKHATGGGNVRLRTGPGVWIYRPLARCRRPRNGGEGPDGTRAAGERGASERRASPRATEAERDAASL